jgi:signal transduction histidine kinase
VDGHKLEKKMLDLEQEMLKRKEAEHALRKAHDELRLFNQELERKVEKRTRELKEKSRQLIEAERLAALGKMANKVAHELRNPLTVIGGFARRMVDKTSDKDPNRKYLQIIVDEVDVLERKVSEVIRIEEKD